MKSGRKQEREKIRTRFSTVGRRLGKTTEGKVAVAGNSKVLHGESGEALLGVVFRGGLQQGLEFICK